MDTLTFGAPRFLRHVTDLSFKKSPVTEFEVPKVNSSSFYVMFFFHLNIMATLHYLTGFGGTWTHNGSVHRLMYP